MGADGLSAPYWEGARRGRLVLQRCAHCGKIRHYPQVLCDACHSFAVEHVESSGAGTVHSWTVTHHAFDKSLAQEVPYVLLTVDMEEGVRVLGRLRGSVAPRLGLPVALGFELDPQDVPLATFTARETSG